MSLVGITSIPSTGQLCLPLLLLVAAVLSKYFLGSRRPKDFPPGPPTLPFIGNLTHVPRVKAFLQFQKMQAEYGSIIGLKIGSQNLVILNSYEHVKALFDQRGSIYSSRANTYLANTLVCPGEIHILLLQYGAEWRKQRKILQSLLSISVVDKLLPLQAAEATQTMFDLLRAPQDYYDHVRRYTTAVILASVYGQRGARFDHPNVQALYHAQDQFTALLEQGASPPIDAFPLLKHLPEALAPWKRRAKAVRVEQRGLYLRLVRETRERIAKGKGGECFLRVMLEEQEKNEMDDEHVAYLAGNLMEAGSDTTASTLLSFLLAMIKHPHEFRKCQAEVDAVCGPTRSPTPADIPHLPFIKACMDETLRHRPVAPAGVPHALSRPDTYAGYHLPAGTVVIANTWAIHHDPAQYEQPNKFLPDRFVGNEFGTLKSEGEAAQEAQRRTTYGFGAGRRVCPGQRLARNSLMLNMAKIAWSFDLSPGAGGAAGAAVDDSIETAYHDGFLIAPKKFAIAITPRSEAHARVVEREYEAIRGFWDGYDD